MRSLLSTVIVGFDVIISIFVDLRFFFWLGEVAGPWAWRRHILPVVFSESMLFIKNFFTVIKVANPPKPQAQNAYTDTADAVSGASGDHEIMLLCVIKVG